MFKKENFSYLKTVAVTFYIGIFCYIMYTCIPIQCPPNNVGDSSLKQEEVNKKQNTTSVQIYLKSKIVFDNISQCSTISDTARYDKTSECIAKQQ